MEKSFFDRDEFIKQLLHTNEWDIIVIGGGATGLGCALDAASRGFSVLLLEANDFAKGTSSRSTKLIHGGVRYLAQANIKLVRQALRERALLLKNGCHLVKKQPFVIPCYSLFEKLKYFVGLKLYDLLAFPSALPSSKLLSSKAILKILPSLKEKGLAGGIIYYDARFDDSRLAINLAQTASKYKAVTLNYFKVTGFIKTDGKVKGVIGIDSETKRQYSIKSKVVINATGVFTNELLELDEPGRNNMVSISRGIHLVVNKSFLNTNDAMLLPVTKDGRVLFIIPWYQHLLIGTTDTQIKNAEIDPKPSEEEIALILDGVKHYLLDPPGKIDILSVFAGLRPLFSKDKSRATKNISREHKLIISESGLITITGGKWTTYRVMAEETINKAIEYGGLKSVKCITTNILIHGATMEVSNDHYDVYGTDALMIKGRINNDAGLAEILVEGFEYTMAEVIWAIENEMARTVEDVLARRLRLLFIDARAAIIAAPKVAKLLAEVLRKDSSWESEEIESFCKLAKSYLLNDEIFSLSL